LGAHEPNFDPVAPVLAKESAERAIPPAQYATVRLNAFSPPGTTRQPLDADAFTGRRVRSHRTRRGFALRRDPY
jgi:hypothetical protein